MTTHPRTPSSRSRAQLLPTHNRLSKPAAFIDVFVDDFIAVAQTSTACARCASQLMHAIDEVLKAPTSSADKFRTPLAV
jgi:hypothetical protein